MMANSEAAEKLEHIEAKERGTGEGKEVW